MAKLLPHFTFRQWLLGLAILAALGAVLCVGIFTRPTSTPKTPPTAATTPAGNSPSNAESTAWSERIASAGADQFRDLLRQLFEIGDESLRERLFAELISTWLNRDPQGFAKYFAALQVYAEENAPLRQLIMKALAEALTKLSPEAAASDYIFAIMSQFVAILAQTDPEEALRWAQKWLLEDMLDSALVSIAREFARTDPRRGIEVALQAGAELRRMQAFYAVGGIWAQTQPDQALAWAAALTIPTERAMVLNSVLLSISQRDPQTAATHLANFQRQMTEEYTQTRQANLAALNLTEADLANDSERYRELLEAGAIAPPASPDIELMVAAARVIAARLAEMDPAAAVAWTNSLEHEFLRTKSVAGLLEGWARTSPADALAFQQANFPKSSELLAAVFDNWAAGNPAEAARAARNLADPTSRARAIESVVGSWVLKEDPAVVAKWLDAVSPVERSDAATSIVAAALSPAIPEQSWARALKITDESQRYRALKAAFSVLVVERPDVARDLLASTPLSSIHHERLSEMLDAVGAAGK